MNKEEYIEDIRAGMNVVLDDYRYNNYRNQIAARKLSADFTQSYNESYLWNKAIFLSTNGCMLLNEKKDTRLAIKSLKQSAEIFENLSLISAEYDRDYSIVLSALCYDLAGYQANALCLTKTIQEYSLITTEEEIDLTGDNYILFQIRQILLKTIPNARAQLRNIETGDLGVFLFNKALESWYDNILNGTENRHISEIERAYKYYNNEANIYLSHLIFLLKSRIKIYSERSIWNNLRGNEFIRNSASWVKYIKLLSYDTYDNNNIKNIEKRVSKFEFWTSQLRAVQKGLFDQDSNFVIQMPTSAGKTFIAELVILDCLVKYPGKKCIYIAPFRALSNEKERELASYLAKLGYSVSALSGSYELDEFQDIILEDTDVLIATPEKIDFLYRQNPNYFNSVSLIVVDEGHIVGDISSRASLLEFLIIRLKIKVPTLKTLFISAVMPPENADEYSVWLTGVQNKVIRALLHEDSTIDEEWEPTRKLIGSFGWSGNNGRITYKNVATENEETKASLDSFIPAIIKKRQFGNSYPDGSTKAQTSASLAYELSLTGNCLVFCAQVRDTERVAKALLTILNLLEESGIEIPLIFQKNIEKESYFFSRKWFGENSHITKCLERGIGVHYGDMPEAVRRSVESDYVDGNLRILISTNTIGQGLNFPIKHLIIHSTIITNGVSVSVRDFWNIIGRAGRAGKETEGQIIFVVNSYTDGVSYSRYTNKANIESAYSMLFNILNALFAARISPETFETYIGFLSESYLLNVIAEEIVETDDQEKIELIINNSLFKVQAEKIGLDIQPIRNSFSRIIKTIKEDVPAELLSAFGGTGFNLKSNQSINNYIDSEKDSLTGIIENDDYLGLLEKILILFGKEEIEEVLSIKLSAIDNGPADYFNVAKLWIEGKEIDELQLEWQNVSLNNNHLNILISDGFYYRYTWGITAFIAIMLVKLNLENEALPQGIRNLSSYLKYGVNNETACLARSIGIKNRDVALLLSEKANYLTGRDFIKWVANLGNEDVSFFEVNIYDRNNILNTAVKLTPNRYNEIPDFFEFGIKGIPFEESRIAIASTLEIGNILEYQREFNNEFDPYAIKVYSNGNELGYLPREFSRIISVEIDINDVEYEINVTDITEEKTYNSIFVKMTKK